MKKFIVCIIAGIFALLSLAACKNPEEINPSGIQESYREVEETDYYFVSNGSSEFIIVIPDEEDQNEQMAASELQMYVKDLLGVTLPVVSDKDIEYNESRKLISVGRTALFEKSGISVDDNELKTSGYIVETRGNNVFLTGSGNTESNYGMLYAVYDLLYELIGLKFYTDDCMVYNGDMFVKMKNFSVKEIPHYDWRDFGAARMTQSYRRKMRLLSGETNYMGTTHTHFLFMPKEKYYEDHPDWYSSNGKHLRLINEEMTLEFIEQVKQFLRDYPQASLVFIGIEDDSSAFSADDAVKTKELYNTNEAGLNIVFLNKVINAVEKWLPTEFPGRTVNYRTLAYYSHFDAPVDYDPETDTFTPHSEYVIPHEKLNIHFTPIGMPSWTQPIHSEANSSVDINIRKWSAITDNMSIYSYGINFRNYLMNFNDFSSFQANVRYCLGLGFNGYYQQGAINSVTSSFEEMRIYVQAQLMWNTALDYKDLCEEFIRVYYGDAAEQILEYFNLTVVNNAINTEENNLSQGTTTGAPGAAVYYPFELVNRMLTLFEEAEKALEPLRSADEDLYSVMLNRVRQQKVTPLYLALNHYSRNFSQTKVREMLNEMETTCASNGILRVDEGDSSSGIQSLIEKWRTDIQ